MSQDVELGCRCGAIHGWVRGVSPSTVNRAICHCDDCQAFLHHLGRAVLLDAYGGTDIVQLAPQSVMFDCGAERIEGLRLTFFDRTTQASSYPITTLSTGEREALRAKCGPNPSVSTR